MHRLRQSRPKGRGTYPGFFKVIPPWTDIRLSSPSSEAAVPGDRRRESHRFPEGGPHSHVEAHYIIRSSTRYLCASALGRQAVRSAPTRAPAPPVFPIRTTFPPPPLLSAPPAPPPVDRGPERPLQQHRVAAGRRDPNSPPWKFWSLLSYGFYII